MPLMKIFGAFNGNNRISKAAKAIIAAEKINNLGRCQFKNGLINGEIPKSAKIVLFYNVRFNSNVCRDLFFQIPQ